MPSSGVELTVVLPTRDEEESLKILLPAIKSTLEGLGVSYELIIVDGRSSDKTVAVAEAEGARVLVQKRSGYADALLEGVAAARGTRLMSMDADGSHPVSTIPLLWARRDEAEVVIASRYVPGGSADMSAWRYGLSRLLNFLTRAFLDFTVQDASGGFRLYQLSALKGLPVVTRDFSVQQEILARLLAAGGRAVEVPFRFGLRVGGESKASLILFARSYLRLFWEVFRLREGDAGLRARTAVLVIGLATGFWGLSWGLPGSERLRVLPERRPLSAESARALSDAWRKLYEQIQRAHERRDAEEPVTYLRGLETVAPGWSVPPGALANSWRSFLLQAVQPDEKKAFIILSRMRPWKLKFEPLYAQYGGAFVYPLGAWLWLASKAGAAVLVADMTHYLMNPWDMGRLYWLGRLFVLAFHLGGLWVLYGLGRRLSGWKTGLAAAALWALAPAAILSAHQVKPHTVALFWGLLSLSALVQALESGRRRHYLICGAGAGFAAASSLLYLPFLALPLAVAAFRRDREDGKEALMASGAGVLILAALNPYLLFSAKAFAWEFLVYGGEKHKLSASGLWSLAVSSGRSAGVPLIFLSGVGLISSQFRRDGRRLLGLVAIVTAAFVFLRFSEFTDPGALRLYLPVLAVAIVLGVDLLLKAPTPVFALVLAVCLADTGARGLAHLGALGRESGPAATRLRAADWIEANIPAGASIGLSRYPEPSSTPPLPFHRWRLILADDPTLLARQKPQWLVSDESRRPFMDSVVEKDYDLAAEFTPPGPGWARVSDPAAFADPGFFVWKKR